MLRISNRTSFLIIMFLCVFSLAYAYYAEYYLEQEPCPLCIVERIIIGSIGILSLIYAIHNPKNFISRIYGMIIAGLAIFNIKIAAHHVWLTNLPPEKRPLSCGLPLDILYDQLTLTNFIHKILQGDAECAQINWRIFGLLAPTAVIIVCSIITLLSLIIVFRKK